MSIKTVLFWSKFNQQTDTSVKSWTNRTIKVSPLHHLGLLAHNKLNHNVVLYSYQKIDNRNFPPNVTLLNASDVYSAKLAFDALNRGQSIAHISDLVRLLVANIEGGIVLDMDAVPLREYPSSIGFCATVPAKQTGAYAMKWGTNYPPLTTNMDWDGKALICFPIMVDVGMSDFINRLTDRIKESIAIGLKKNSKDWNFIMWSLKEVPRINADYRVYPPIGFAPVPAWLQGGSCYSLEYPTRFTGNIELFGYRLPSIAEILNRSYVVQHFFESAMRDSQVSSDTFWLWVKPECLLGREAQYILGDDWQYILDNNVNRV